MFKKKPLRINSYLSYGTIAHFRASGRALKFRNVEFIDDLGRLKTLINIYKQFESDEIRNTQLNIKLSNGLSFETKTDKEGYYIFDKDIKNLDRLTSSMGWVSYLVSYKNAEQKILKDNIFEGQMLIPSKNANYGIISDIDDTILHTGVASFMKWRLIRNTFFRNFDKRMPLEGTSQFYKKLQLGTLDKPLNPFFYISNSPWNLYDYLTAFLQRHYFPKGPILLRDLKHPFEKKPKNKLPHKEKEIINLLTLYPNLKFVLIGDSGEKDADIYTKIAAQYPNRILAIYVRSVNHTGRFNRIQRIVDSFKTTPILQVKTSKEAEIHARSIGLIK
ncbi:App1 family protein [Aquimarina sp. W85]|uniref:App1 family protein n=1 Tax=Aquimarina rhodophyticola TaxID=3342246 RepID=UPI0036722FFB